MRSPSEINEVQADGWIWWKHGVIYQLYPRSFMDSNDDGIGDLRGVIEKLDYLKKLGIAAIWLSPIYQSPMEDYGYDIVDYRSIDPSYGTMDDFKELLSLAHQKGIRIIMDMVMNHSSHLHRWFIESKSSLDNPKRDWYIWKAKRNGKVPTNWKSAFGGSVWQWDQHTQQYYLHSFLKGQPDLNWRNKKLREAFFDVFKFWLDLGVDGFRLDVINFIVKDKKFRDNMGSIWSWSFNAKLYSRNRDSSIKIVRNLRQLVDRYDDRMLVGEIYTPPPGNNKTVINYLGDGDNALHLAFDFSLIFRFWNAHSYYKCIQSWEDNLPVKGWPSYVLSNHDILRSYNRLGIGNNKAAKAKISAILLLTLRGTPFIYYGEEIGMQNQKIKKRHIRDPLGKKLWPFFSGRDKSRTPMQWSDKKNGGFSKSKPWLPSNRNYLSVNVEKQKTDQNSLLNHYTRLMKIRNSYQALSAGRMIFEQTGENEILSYTRGFSHQRIHILLNFGNKKSIAGLPKGYQWKVIFSTHKRLAESFENNISLKPFEGIIFIREIV